MKRKHHLPLGALALAALLPLVGCTSTDTTAADDALTESAPVEPAVEIVRPTVEAGTEPTEDAIVAEIPEPKKKWAIFGGKGKDREVEEASPELADVDADAGAEESVVEVIDEGKPRRKPLFGSRKDKGSTEVAEVKEKKKFRLFGFGRKQDAEAEEIVELAEDALADADTAPLPSEEVIEAPAPDFEESPTRLPWDDPSPVIASYPGEVLPDPSGLYSDDPVGSGSTGSARIRPSDTGGSRIPASIPDAAPVLPTFPKADSDGFVPLTPEPKFPDEEGILPPGS